MSFHDLMHDRVSLVKADGTRVDDIPASVQGDTVYIMRSEPLIESGDLLVRQLSNGARETLQVIDPGFSEGFEDIPARYKIAVRRLSAGEASAAIQSITYNIVNINNSTVGAVQTGSESAANVNVQASRDSKRLKPKQFEFMQKLHAMTNGNPGIPAKGAEVAVAAGYKDGMERELLEDIKGLESFGFVKAEVWLHRIPMRVYITPAGLEVI